MPTAHDNPNAHAEHISEALHGKRVTGGWRSHCPAHDDHTPSLDISVKDGSLLVICRAGCGQPSVIEALKERGLWPQNSAEAPRRRNEPVARYTYRDIDGMVVGYKERFEFVKDGIREKVGVWHAPDGEKKLPHGTKGFLYRLERVQITAPEAPILFVEGEKCVRAAEELGFVAVSAPNGAKSRPDPAWIPLFRDRIVWLLPDNDDPGREHMSLMAAALRAAGASVQTITLPSLPDKGDICEWIEAGGTRERLQALAATAGVPADGRPRLLTVPSMADVQLEEVTWLWHPYIPSGKFTLIEGDPGVRKSWLVLAIAAAVSLGAPLPDDKRDRQPGRVLLLAGEDGLGDTIKPRLLAMKAQLHNIRPVLGLLHEDEEQPMTLSEDGIRALIAEVETFRPALVIIDPLVAYTSRDVDMNKANEVRSMLRPLTEMAQRLNVAVVALRHLNKTVGGSAGYRGQGSIDYFAISRSVLFIGQDRNDPARSIMVPNKSSLTQKGAGQAFRLGPGEHGAEFYWDGRADTTVEELLATPEEPDQLSALEEAKTFLREVLFTGPVQGKEVQKTAREAGVSERTLWRAKSELRIHASKGLGPGGQWFWTLPTLDEGANSANAAKDASRGQGWQSGRVGEPARLPYRDDDEEMGF